MAVVDNTVGLPVNGCSAVDIPPMSQRSQIANSGRMMAACSAACNAPAPREIHADGVGRGLVDVVPDPTGVQGLLRKVERHGRQHRAIRCPSLVLHHLRGHRHRTERHADRTILPAGEHGRHLHVGRRAGVGTPVRSGGFNQCDPALKIKILHEVALASMQIDRPAVHRGGRGRGRRYRASDRCPPPPPPAPGPSPGCPPRPRTLAGRGRTSPWTAAQHRRPPARRARRPPGPAEDPADVGLGQRQLAAAHASCGASTYGLPGSRTHPSTGAPSSASGWCTR